MFEISVSLKTIHLHKLLHEHYYQTFCLEQWLFFISNITLEYFKLCIVFSKQAMYNNSYRNPCFKYLSVQNIQYIQKLCLHKIVQISTAVVKILFKICVETFEIPQKLFCTKCLSLDKICTHHWKKTTIDFHRLEWNVSTLVRCSYTRWSFETFWKINLIFSQKT